MSPELERELVNKYPKLFDDYGTAPSHSPMAFGFECGDGWFDLLDTLCGELAALGPCGGDGDAHPLRAMQVKEKYGTLRFYLGPATDEALALVAFAEALSARICETCGNKGRTRGTTWLKTLCDPCAEKQGYTDAVESL
ncbi:MAG: hypothetical protein KGJ66_07825 [Alphaproteobacteria bacterium]|nr:hypothetical protein [Alphaproteobacteria bacterium]